MVKVVTVAKNIYFMSESIIFYFTLHQHDRERSASAVECLTPDGRATDLILTSVTALWSLSKTHLS